MNGFDQRWHKLTEQARRAPPDLALGFAMRITARWREPQGESWVDLLSAFGARALIAATCVLVASAGLALTQWHEVRIEPPALETAITSELAWP